MITQLVKRYDFSKVTWRSMEEPATLDPVFAVTFKAIPAKLEDGPLFHTANLKVTVDTKRENLTEQDKKDYYFNRILQNYFSRKAPDGSCKVMEAALFMECDWNPWIIGFPLSLIEEPEKEHEFAILFNGVYFNILCDGIVLDREAPEEGNLLHVYPTGGSFSIFSKNINSLRFVNSLDAIEQHEEKIERDIPISYYTPYGFNTWIGDVVTLSYKGVFHVFYLHDRRHHNSRRKKGAHEFWHLTSSDLKNWVDHGPVLELTEPWQSTGTGNAFIYNDKLYLGIGLHTERVRPWNQLATQLFQHNLRLFGHTGEFDFSQLGTLTPSGATYVSSSDGIHFTPSHKLMHFLTNPSIYPQENGVLHLYHAGQWESDHLGSWKLVDPSFPPGGPKTFTRNCHDCPNLFSLGDWDYLMIGFTGFYGKKKGEKEWIDFTEKGWEPYDGACVPVAADFNGRMVEGSWPGGNSWGSCLLFRELIPLGNGRLGKRWIPETLPEFDEPQKAGPEITLPEGSIYTLLEMEVDPANGLFTALFQGENGENDIEFSLDAAKGRAQWSSTPGKKILSCREKMLEHPEYTSFNMYSDLHYQSRDYAKEELTELSAPFRIRFIICRDPKFDTTLIDTEIDGKYTMLTNRNDLHAKKVIFCGGEKITMGKKVQ